MIRVGVAAAAVALRVGLREVLNNLPDVTVMAEAAHPDELPTFDVDVLVLADAASSLDMLEKTTALLLLTDDTADVQPISERSLTWGALPMNASEDELSAALHALAEGLWVGAPALMRNLLTRKPAVPFDESGETLTSREVEVLQLAAQGLPNKQIALALGISEHTVKFHLSSLYAKLGVASRTEAVHAGARRGWVVL